MNEPTNGNAGVPASEPPKRPNGVDVALNMMRETKGGQEVKLWTPMCWDFARYVAQLEALASGVAASVPADPDCTCGSDSPRAFNHAANCPQSTPWNERVKARIASGVPPTDGGQKNG